MPVMALTSEYQITIQPRCRRCRRATVTEGNVTERNVTEGNVTERNVTERNVTERK
jgi:hypothetical protein